MSVVIEVINLSRSFHRSQSLRDKSNDTVEALRGISFQVNKGQVFGLLGPNGAGKTTTLKILSTMLAPSGGEAKIFGLDTFGQEQQIRPFINFIFGGDKGFYWRLSAVEILTFFADLYGVPRSIQKKRIPYLLDLVGLSIIDAQRNTESYSKGMKQKVQIARGLINDPKVIFFDEPTLGLDPASAIEFRAIVTNLAASGKTIILTTHYMAEAQQLCDQISLIDQGRIIAAGDTQSFIELAGKHNIIEFSYKAQESSKIALLIASREPLFHKEQKIAFSVEDSNKAKALTGQILQQFDPIELKLRKPTLEEAYLALTGN